MDIRDFKDIGIVELYWDYREFSCEWEKVFISLYIPKEIGYEYGKQYCLRISFLDNNNVVETETFESSKNELILIEKIGSIKLIMLLGLKLKVNNDQLNLLRKYFKLEYGDNMKDVRYEEWIDKECKVSKALTKLIELEDIFSDINDYFIDNKERYNDFEDFMLNIDNIRYKLVKKVEEDKSLLNI